MHALSTGKSYGLTPISDAEWSIAVGLEDERDGTPKEKDMQIKGVYPWGTQWPPPSGAGNYGDLTCQQKYPGMPNIEGYVDGYAETAPVGSFKPNRYDLHDLGGNVLVIQTPSRLHDQGLLF